jgi:hypothetical protein
MNAIDLARQIPLIEPQPAARAIDHPGSERGPVRIARQREGRGVSRKSMNHRGEGWAARREGLNRTSVAIP